MSQSSSKLPTQHTDPYFIDPELDSCEFDEIKPKSLETSFMGHNKTDKNLATALAEKCIDVLVAEGIPYSDIDSLHSKIRHAFLEEVPEVKAVDQLRRALNREPPVPQKPYSNAKKDGKPSTFLQAEYGNQISDGRLYAGALKKIDETLFSSLNNELQYHNRTFKNPKRTFSDYLPSKRQIADEGREAFAILAGKEKKDALHLLYLLRDRKTISDSDIGR